MKRLFCIMLSIILLTPLGLLLPEVFKAGGAWGEWDVDEIKEMIGYIPEGLHKLSNIWHSPIPDYELKGWNRYIAYIFSGVIGVAMVVIAVYIFGRLITKKGKKNVSP